jgi:adenosylcobinamide-GDP ribazoletransferase
LSFLAALQLLTNIPLTIKRELSPARMGKATTWFPLVGLIIGCILAFTNLVLNIVLPPPVVNALLIVIWVMVTGAMHLDGFADTCDGLAGHKPVEERWRIMHDSRTGAFGVVGIALLLLVKYIALSTLPARSIIPALVVIPVISRWAMVYAIFAFPYARPEGLGKAYKDATRWPQFTIATVITIVIIAALILRGMAVAGLLVMFGVCIFTTLLALYFKHKFAGLTGDTYGAINETAEVMALLLVIVLA